MVLRATYRRRGEPSAPTRVVDIDRPEYAGAWAVARADVGTDEVLLHVRRIEAEEAS